MIRLLLIYNLLCAAFISVDSVYRHEHRETGCLLAIPETQSPQAEYDAGDYLLEVNTRHQTAVLELQLDREWVQGADCMEIYLISPSDSTRFVHRFASNQSWENTPFLLQGTCQIHGATRLQGKIHYHNGTATELSIAEGTLPHKQTRPFFPKTWKFNLKIR